MRKNILSLAAILIGVVALPFPALGAGSPSSPPVSAITTSAGVPPTNSDSASTTASSSASSSSTSTGAPAGESTDPTSSAAEKDVSFGIAPASHVPANQYIDGRPSYLILSSPGGFDEDRLALVNYATKPVKLSVYPADASQNSAGQVEMSLAKQKLTDAGSWFRLEGRKRLTVVVPPRHLSPAGKAVYGETFIPFTVRIPRSASPGDHVAGLIASYSAKAKNKQGANITLDQRIGVRAYFHLTGPVSAALKVSNLKPNWSEPGNYRGLSDLTVSYTVTNIGNIRLNASMLINTDRWFLKPVRSYPPMVDDLFPGSSVRVSETVGPLTGTGRMKTTVTAFGTSVAGDAYASAPPAQATARFWAIPWILIAIVLGALLFLVANAESVRRYRKYRKEHPRQPGRRKSARNGRTASPKPLTEG